MPLTSQHFCDQFPVIGSKGEQEVIKKWEENMFDNINGYFEFDYMLVIEFEKL